VLQWNEEDIRFQPAIAGSTERERSGEEKGRNPALPFSSRNDKHIFTGEALADGVLFEFGPSRQQDLTLRDRIRRWQPHLRTLFPDRVALLKYRLRLSGFDLPEPVELAQQEFDEELAKVLDGMADRMAGKVSEKKR